LVVLATLSLTTLTLPALVVLATLALAAVTVAVASIALAVTPVAGLSAADLQVIQPALVLRQLHFPFGERLAISAQIDLRLVAVAGFAVPRGSFGPVTAATATAVGPVVGTVLSR